jgi:tetratricopeptide (TPR) repeat protein
MQLKPDYAEPYNNLGLVLRDQEQLDDAIGYYQRALELKPDYAEAYSNLASALTEQGKLNEAVEYCCRARDLKPGFAQTHNNLGAALWEQGKQDESVASYRRALELNPDYADARDNLGIALKEQGKLDEAVACYRQVVQLNSGGIPRVDPNCHESPECYPPSLQTPSRCAAMHNRLAKAFGQLAVLLQSRLPEADILAMRQLSSEQHLRDDARAALHFGLAQTLDARGDYNAAAQHFNEANAARLACLKKRKESYNAVKHTSFISNMLAAFTPQFFERVRGFGLQTELPVFIVGLPRSGTTLVEQILASHPLVFGGGELRNCEETFQLIPKVMNRNDTPFKCLPSLDQETTQRLAQQHLDRMRALNQEALRIVDKMPGNYQYLGLIRALFPQSRIIHCRRDFRDVAVSCRMTNFALVPWACEPAQIISYFEQYSRLMTHWRQVLPSPPLDVAYEEMVDNTEGVARRIVHWCELDWDPNCLRFYDTQRLVKTASVAQVRRPIYKSSVGRWKNYEILLSELFSCLNEMEERWFKRHKTTDPGR